ncbi:MAG: FkbM family methyltransferase [Candidatus Micrarchaeota archaeon]|nr:FkbM family methyltransferase [Candidatus Micrarchaeota archaeon]MDE1847561.1 FkbM family methyltransferase [Candidatus Micrarchaeota archaeon]MDE1864278.1 FkbM family methyltransferase [Candidatus Micrarchaeota archaeon]
MQRNPITALIKYAIGDKSSSLDVVYKHVKNWHSLPMLVLGLKNEIDIITKDGRNFRVKVRKGFVEMQYKNRQLRFVYSQKKEVIHIVLMLIGEFIAEPHKNLKIKDKLVVDVGAYIADTAIYFALNGAKHVYAVEPYPHSCEIGKMNIEANNLSSRITLINAGCASKSGTMKIDPKFENLAGAQIKEARKGKQVSVITLSSMVKKYGLKDAALKIDCEGCEYDIIAGTPKQTLRKFSDMLIEYHYGYKPLIERLSKMGFNTSHTGPEKSFNANTNKKEMYMGDISASRK